MICCRVRRCSMSVAGLRGAAGVFLAASLLAPAFLTPVFLATRAFAQSFPFGRELLLDADPMRGSKKIPVLDIAENGTAEIELWCNSVKAQLIIAANTITIIAGEKSARQCSPDRARADDELLDALNQATNWRMEPSALVFTGGKTLRFRVQTN
jgi:heat shock protein HslJ